MKLLEDELDLMTLKWEKEMVGRKEEDEESKETISDLKLSVTGFKRENERLSEEYDSLKGGYDKMKKNFMFSQQNLEEELSRVKHREFATLEEVQRFQDESSRLERDVERQKEEMDVFDVQNRELVSRVAGLQSALNTTTQELDFSKNTHDLAIQDLETRYNTVNGEREALSRQMEGLSTAMIALVDKFNEERKKNEEDQKTILSLTSLQVSTSSSKYSKYRSSFLYLFRRN